MQSLKGGGQHPQVVKVLVVVDRVLDHLLRPDRPRPQGVDQHDVGHSVSEVFDALDGAYCFFDVGVEPGEELCPAEIGGRVLHGNQIYSN